MLTRATTVTRRPAGPADEPFLRTLFADSRPELAMLPAHTRDVLVDMQFVAQQRQYAASFPHARRTIIVADGTDVGRLVVDDAPDALRIVDVTVHATHRNRGIGSSILHQVIDEASASGRPVRLSVWSGNTEAQRLYDHLGFVPVHDDGSGYLQMQWNAVPRSEAQCNSAGGRVDD